MKIICIKNTGNFTTLVLPMDQTKCVSADNYVSSNEWYTIDSAVSGYNVTIGKEYFVYGILLNEMQKRYLIVDDRGIPYFMPAELFTVEDDVSWWDWEELSFYAGETEYKVFASFDLITSYEDLVSLVGLNPKGLKCFLDYKRYLEDYFL